MRGLIPGLPDAFDDRVVQPFVPNRAVAARHIAVLLRVSGWDVPGFSPSVTLEGNPLIFGSFSQLFSKVCGAIGDPCGFWLAAPFVAAVQTADNTLCCCEKGRKTVRDIGLLTIEEVNLDARSRAVAIIRHGQQPEVTAHHPIGWP